MRQGEVYQDSKGNLIQIDRVMSDDVVYSYKESKGWHDPVMVSLATLSSLNLKLIHGGQDMRVKQLNTKDVGKVFTQYIQKQGKRCGCVVLVDQGDKVTFGWSKYACNKEEKPYSRKQGRAMAIGRALRGKPMSTEELPYLIQKHLPRVLATGKKYFGNKEPQNLER